MIEVKNLQKTCETCPSQWEFQTFQDRPVYVRYRWGTLDIRIGRPGKDVWDAVNGPSIVYESLGEEFDGSLSWSEVESKLKLLSQDQILNLRGVEAYDLYCSICKGECRGGH